MPNESRPPASNPAAHSGSASGGTAPGVIRPPLPVRLRAYRLLLGLAGGVLALDQVTKFWVATQVPFNPLHDEFMPSIGCAPCTRAIGVGEDFRAGRWWWDDEAAKECGLHVSQATQVSALRSF